jgi:7,8-dihydroneopterin aldolase/epimerase/oxygenase
MNSTMNIELLNLRFHAFHGLYPEEQLTGNEFEVNLFISYSINKEIIETIDDTINYAAAYQIVKKQMLIQTDLLETLAMRITKELYTAFPLIKKIDISIAKLHPPIERFSGKVAVHYIVEY